MTNRAKAKGTGEWKGRYWRSRHRIENAWWDLRAIIAGYCNDCPWRAASGDGGGYSFWRCGLDSGHEGLHRSRNYVWDEDGRTTYVPVDNTAAAKLTGHPYADQPWNRNPTLTRRQTKATDAWYSQREAARNSGAA